MADGREASAQPLAPATGTLQLTVPEPRRNGHPPVDDTPPPAVPLPGRPLGPLFAVLLAGVLAGGVVGAFAAALAGTQSTATALVQLAATPDPGLAAVAGTSTSEDGTEAFVAAELAWLAGDGLATGVADRIGPAGGDPDELPEITVTRVGQSTVAQVAATGATDTEALRLARTAVDVYTERRRDAFRASVEGSLASVDRTLRDIAPPPGEDAPPDARVDRLEALRTDLLLLGNRDDSGVQVLEPPVLDRPGLPSWVLGTVLGAALGGLVALGALELHRSRRRTLVGAAQAAAITDRVLHPEVRLPADWRTRTLQVLRANDRETARLLVAQIARRRPMGGHVVAVAGASAGSASRAVATMIAVGLARQTPTVLAEINAAGPPHPLVPADPLGVLPPAGRRIPTQMDGLEMFRLDRPPHAAEDEAWTVLLDLARSSGRCVVVDAGPASEVLRLLPATSEPVLVLGVGVDDVARATALAAAVRIGTAPLLGVVTRQPWQARLRRRTLARVDG